MATTISILLNKITSSTNIKIGDSNVEQLYNPYIKSKYTKIVRHKKIIPTIQKV